LVSVYCCVSVCLSVYLSALDCRHREYKDKVLSYSLRPYSTTPDIDIDTDSSDTPIYTLTSDTCDFLTRILARMSVSMSVSWNAAFTEYWARSSPQCTGSQPAYAGDYKPSTAGCRLPLLFVRPAVTFPAEDCHRPSTSTKLYCLVTEAHGCEQLAQGCYTRQRGGRARSRDH